MSVSRDRIRRYLWVPPLATALVAIGPAALLPGRYQLLPWAVSTALLGFGIVFGIFLVVWERSGYYSGIIRAVGAFVVVMSAMTVVSFTNLFAIIFVAGPNLRGISLLASAAIVWLANVMSFALWYWYLDGVAKADRTSRELVFPELSLAGAETWQPNFVDYLFVSLTVALAFGPTDTPPASTRLRVVMIAEALISFVTVALVFARAFNAIG